MAHGKVKRRARKVLGQDPEALVWCSLRHAIPKPPPEVRRAAGRVRLKQRQHWLVYVGMVVFCVIVVPWMLLERLSSGPSRSARRQGPAGPDAEPGRSLFDGDWNLAAGQLLLRWYAVSPSPARLVLLTRDRVCLAASPRRRVSPSKAADFRIVTEFAAHEVRVTAESGQPRGFATFQLRFADGSWLELGRLADPEDADHFLALVSA